jgi:fructose-specific phosphotransferase system IIC component
LWIKFSLFSAAVSHTEFIQLQTKCHIYQIGILKNAVVASALVLHRHLFQENDREATKTSFMLANSLVKALSGYLLNVRRHVTAKLG